jgi:hypothetical protein
MDHDAKDEAEQLKNQVLAFLVMWPSKHPSPSRIANHIGTSPEVVIAELARLRSSGEYPPLPADQGPAQSSVPQVWDRVN